MKTFALLFLVSYVAAEGRIRRQTGTYTGTGYNAGFVAPQFSSGNFNGASPVGFGPLSQVSGYPAQTQAGYANGNNLGYARGRTTRVHNNGEYTGIHNVPYPSSSRVNSAYAAENSGTYQDGGGYTGDDAGSYGGLGALQGVEANNPYNGAPSGGYTEGRLDYGAINSAQTGTDVFNSPVIPGQGGENGPVYAGGNVPGYQPSVSPSFSPGGRSSSETESIPSYSTVGGEGFGGGSNYDFSGNNDDSYAANGGNRNLAGA